MPTVDDFLKKYGSGSQDEEKEEQQGGGSSSRVDAFLAQYGSQEQRAQEQRPAAPRAQTAPNSQTVQMQPNSNLTEVAPPVNWEAQSVAPNPNARSNKDMLRMADRPTQASQNYLISKGIIDATPEQKRAAYEANWRANEAAGMTREDWFRSVVGNASKLEQDRQNLADRISGLESQIGTNTRDLEDLIRHEQSGLPAGAAYVESQSVKGLRQIIAKDQDALSAEKRSLEELERELAVANEFADYARQYDPNKGKSQAERNWEAIGAGIEHGARTLNEWGGAALNWALGEDSLPYKGAKELTALGGKAINAIAGDQVFDVEAFENARNNPITRKYEESKQSNEKFDNYVAELTFDNKTAQNIEKHTSGLVINLPFIALNAITLGTGGTAAAGAIDSTQALLRAGRVARAGSGLGIVVPALESYAAAAATNPAMQWSYLTTFGSSLREAEEDGITGSKATLYAMLNSVINTQIEFGGGFETGPLANKNFIRTVVEEIGEEELQGLFERGLKAVYKDVDWVDMSGGNPDAVLNPQVMAETAVDTFVGTLLQAPFQAVSQRIVSSALKTDMQRCLELLNSAENDADQITVLERIQNDKKLSEAFEDMYKASPEVVLEELNQNAQHEAEELYAKEEADQREPTEWSGETYRAGESRERIEPAPAEVGSSGTYTGVDALLGVDPRAQSQETAPTQEELFPNKPALKNDAKTRSQKRVARLLNQAQTQEQWEATLREIVDDPALAQAYYDITEREASEDLDSLTAMRQEPAGRDLAQRGIPAPANTGNALEAASREFNIENRLGESREPTNNGAIKSFTVWPNMNYDRIAEWQNRNARDARNAGVDFLIGDQYNGNTNLYSGNLASTPSVTPGESYERSKTSEAEARWNKIVQKAGYNPVELETEAKEASRRASEETARLNRAKARNGDFQTQRSYEASLAANDRADDYTGSDYDELVDAARRQIADDKRNEARIAAGEDEWAPNPASERERDPLSAAGRARILREATGREYYVSDGKVVLAKHEIKSDTDQRSKYFYERELKDAGVGEVSQRELQRGEFMNLGEKTKASDREAPPEYVGRMRADYDDNELDELSRGVKRADARRHRQNFESWRIEQYGGELITDPWLGTPNSSLRSDQLQRIMRNMEKLKALVKGTGNFKGYHIDKRFDMLRAMFPDANWRINTKNDTIYLDGMPTKTSLPDWMWQPDTGKGGNENAISRSQQTPGNQRAERGKVKQADRGTTRRALDEQPTLGLESAKTKCGHSERAWRRHGRISNRLSELGFQVYTNRSLPSSARSIQRVCLSLAPDCPVTFFSSKGITMDNATPEQNRALEHGAVFQEEFDGRSTGVFVDLARIEEAAKSQGTTAVSAVMHDIGHYYIAELGVDTLDVVQNLVKNTSEPGRKTALHALDLAFDNAADNNPQIALSPSLTDAQKTKAIWDEVVCDLFGNVDRYFKTMPGSLNYLSFVKSCRAFFNDFDSNAYAKAKGVSGTRSFFPESSAVSKEERQRRGDYRLGPKAAAKLDAEAHANTPAVDLYDDGGIDVNADDFELPYRTDNEEMQRRVDSRAAEEEDYQEENEQAPAEPSQEEEVNPAEMNKAALELRFGEERMASLQKSGEQMKELVGESFLKDGGVPEAGSEGAQEVVRAYADMLEGKATPKDVCDAYLNLRRKSSGVAQNYFFDEKLEGLFDSLSKDYDRFVTSEEHEKRLREEYADRFERASRILSHRFAYAKEKLQARVALQEAFQLSKGSKVGKNVIASLQDAKKRQELRPSTAFRYLAGLDPKGGEALYAIADEIDRSLSNRINTYETAEDYLSELSSMKGFKDFMNGKKTVKNVLSGVPGKEISATHALSLLKTLETSGVFEDLLHGADITLNLPSGETVTFDPLSEATRRAYISAKNGTEARKAAKHARDELNKLIRDLHAIIDADPLLKTAYDSSFGVFGYLKRAVNKSSRTNWGADFASQGKNYYPVSAIVDSSGPRLLNAPSYGLNENKRLIERKHAGHLQINSFTDVMESYIQDMSHWSAYQGLSDLLDLYSRQSDTLPSLTDLTKTKFGDKSGAKWNDWLEDYVKDLNKTREGSKYPILSRIRSNLALSSLSLNVGVALKQTASAFNFAGVVDYDIVLSRFATGLLKTKGMYKNNPLIQAVGEYTRFLDSRESENHAFGDSTEYQKDTWISKFVKWSHIQGLISRMDYRTVANGMLACADQVKRNHKGDANFKTESDAYYKEVAALFEKAVMNTQPIYDREFRAEYLRTSNEIVRGLAMFRTQQTQNYNNFVESSGELTAAKERLKAAREDAKESGSKQVQKALDEAKADVRNARKKAYGTRGGLISSALVLAAINIGTSFLRHKLRKYRDDDDELDWEEILAQGGYDALSSLLGTEWILGRLAPLAIDVITGMDKNLPDSQLDYGLEDAGLAVVNDALTAIKSFSKAPTPNSGKALVFSLASVFGIPMSNAYRILNTVTMYAGDFTGVNYDHSDDFVSVWNAWWKADAAQRGRISMRRALSMLENGTLLTQAEAILSSIGRDNDTLNAARNELKQQYILGVIDEKTYRDILQKYCGVIGRSVLDDLVESGNAKRRFNEAESRALVLDKDAAEAAKERLGDLNSKNDPTFQTRMDTILDLGLSVEHTDAYVEHYSSKAYYSNYSVLREAGLSPLRANDMIQNFDLNSDGKFSQDELWTQYQLSPSTERYIELLWNEHGWTGKNTKTWDAYRAHQEGK